MNTSFLYLEGTPDFESDSAIPCLGSPTRVILDKDAEITSFLIPIGDVGTIQAVTIVDEETGNEVAGSIVEIKRAYDSREYLITIKTILDFLE